MGQPAHSLATHSGHTQLWSWAAFTGAQSLYYGPFHQRLCLAYKYLILFLTMPFFVPTHPWVANFRFYTKGLVRFRPATLYNPAPNFAEKPFLKSRLFRTFPRRVLFKDGDQNVWQDATTDNRAWGKRVWGQVKTFNLAGTTLFAIQGLSLFGPLSSPTSVKRVTHASLKPRWFEAHTRVRYLIKPLQPLLASTKHRSTFNKPDFWL